MNVYDSGKISAFLRADGMVEADIWQNADVIVLNTCHIRAKAAEKIYAELGRIAMSKKRGAIVVVAGCMAQHEGNAIMRRASVVDIVAGPHSYHRLNSFVERIKNGEKHVLDVHLNAEEKFRAMGDMQSSNSISAFLAVQEGCNKFCHYCVVPYTRGREYSRPVRDILHEAKVLIANGVKEITLLGQNFSGYCGLWRNNIKLNAGCLISELAQIDGLDRIRYTTSHPIDMVESGLYNVHAVEQKLMPFLHLPIQSGSDNILNAMNRRHNREFYCDIIEKFRAVRSDIAFSSDFIVGYPGETDDDFQQTISLIKNIGYAQAFSFTYSPRPNTPAAKMSNQVDASVKERRLATLQAVIADCQLKFNCSKIGEIMDVLIMKTGKHKQQLIGKSPYMQSVVIDMKDDDAIQQVLANRLVKVHIVDAFQNSIRGELLHTIP